MSDTSYDYAILTFADTNQSIEGISKIILLHDKFFVLLDPHLFGERNVKCYGATGGLVWTIADPIRVHDKYETYFVGMTIQDKRLLVYSRDGMEYDVSFETGLFNKYLLVK